MTSVRLSEDIEEKLNFLSHTKRLSKTEIIRIAITNYIEHENVSDPYELGKDLFDLSGSGESNRSQNYKKVIKDKLHGKYSH